MSSITLSTVSGWLRYDEWPRRASDISGHEKERMIESSLTRVARNRVHVRPRFSRQLHRKLLPRKYERLVARAVQIRGGVMKVARIGEGLVQRVERHRLELRHPACLLVMRDIIVEYLFRIVDPTRRGGSLSQQFQYEGRASLELVEAHERR
jgi:hypothetical protein